MDRPQQQQQLSLENALKDWQSLRQKLSCENLKALDSSSVPLLLDAMASALKSAITLIQILDDNPGQGVAMQACVDLLVDMTAWLVQEGELVQHLGLDALCSSITQVVDRALQLSHAALFSLRWYTALGGELFQTCCTSVRGVIKDIASLAYGLVSIWSDDLQTHNDRNSSPEHLQPCKTLASMLVQHLVDLGVTSADAVLSGQCDLPKEMISLATVNVCWGALTKVMTGLPTSQPPLVDASLAVQVIQLNLEYLRQWLEHFMRPPHDANKLKVIRFWTMHLTKLVGTYVSCASQCWPLLASTSLCLYQFLARSIQASVEDEEQIRADLEQHLAPKLVQLIMMCLEEEAQEGSGNASAGDLEAVMEKVQLLSSELPDSMPQLSDGEEPDSLPKSAVLGRLLLVAAMLSRAPLLSSSSGLLAMARTLLPWVFKATAVEAYPNLSPRCHLGDGPLGLVSSGAVDLLSACSSFAITNNNATAMEAWKECLVQLYRMALDVHPALQHLASTTLACFMAAATPEAAAQQLVQLGSLVEVFASAEAVAQSGSSGAEGITGLGVEAVEGVFGAGPSSSTSSVACRAGHLLRAALQVAPGCATSAAYQQLNLDSSSCDSATSDLAASLATALLLGSFFHATPCSLASEVVPWLMGLVRRTVQLHDVVQGTAQGVEEAAVVASLHLAAVLMALESIVRQAQQLVQAGSDDADAAGRAVAQAAASAADVLRAWSSPYTSSSSLPPQEAHSSPPFHVVWALRVVSRAGASLSAEALSSVMPALLLLVDQPSCSVHVAAAAAHYSCVEPLPADLFHALLHKGHWALQHEALLALVSVSRVCTAGDFRALIPKDLFTSSAAAHESCLEAGPQAPQQVVFKLGKAYKAYLERRPGQDTVEVSALQSLREAEGQALQQLGASMQQQGGAASLTSLLSSRLDAGFRTLACCADSAINPAPSSSACLQQPLLTQLVLEGKANLATASQAVTALESSLLSLQHAVHSGSAFSGMNPGDARAQLHSHTSYLLAELASTGSKLRSLQDVIHTIR